ncbi:hypothetical protein D9M69_613320 [compost metagenome]
MRAVETLQHHGFALVQGGQIGGQAAVVGQAGQHRAASVVQRRGGHAGAHGLGKHRPGAIAARGRVLVKQAVVQHLVEQARGRALGHGQARRHVGEAQVRRAFCVKRQHALDAIENTHVYSKKRNLSSY